MGLWHHNPMLFYPQKYIGLILILIFSVDSYAAKHMVLKVVASIEKTIITNRDVEVGSIVDDLLYNEGVYRPLKYGTEDFASHLNRLLIERMVNTEADVFGVAKVSEKEVEETTQSIKDKIQKNPVIKERWAALEIKESQLKELVGRKLKANRFIKYKSNSSYVQVSDDEARDYFNKNKLKFGTEEFDSFKATIKNVLGRKNAEDRLRDWLDVLRKKHQVKNLVSGAPVREGEK
jgi:hypothetical protein